MCLCLCGRERETDGDFVEEDVAKHKIKDERGRRGSRGEQRRRRRRGMVVLFCTNEAGVMSLTETWKEKIKNKKTKR